MTTINGWKTNDGTYQVVANDFINTGGSQMVLVVTVYDRSANCTQYVMVNEETCNLSTVNFIELDVDYEDDMLVAYYDRINQDALESVTSVVREDQLNQLFDRCWEEYLKQYCQYFKTKWRLEVEELPIALRNKMPADYKEWLEENSQLVVTDGEQIFIDEMFVKESCKEPQYIKDLKQLKDYMIHQTTLMDGTPEELDEFYNMKATISFGNMIVTLDNSAAVFEALKDAIDYIISQE